MKLKSNPAMDPWDIDDVNFPFCGTPLEKWKFLIGYAVLAPSNHNSQPWRFRIREDQLELYADRARASRVSDPNDRELVISCGCALQHLLLAMHHFDLFGGFEILPEPANPDLLARVLMGREGNKSMENITLFYAITKRRTNRQRFHDEPLPELTLRSLQNAAEQESAWLHLVCEDEMKHDLADLISEGDRCQWENKSFRAELSKWVHSNRSTVRDGIPGYAQGVDDLMYCAGPLVVRTFDMGKGQAATNHELATCSPALAVLGTKCDAPCDWILAGQALAQVLLRARVEDVWASFLNQPIELPYLRAKVRKILGTPGFPQAILRLGFGNDIKPTPRRGVEEVLF